MSVILSLAVITKQKIVMTLFRLEVNVDGTIYNKRMSVDDDLLVLFVKRFLTARGENFKTVNSWRDNNRPSNYSSSNTSVA